MSAARLTADQVREMVDKLRALATGKPDDIGGFSVGVDNEDVHIQEDNLYLVVLRAIAGGADDPAALAHEVLKAREIDYHRYYV